MNTSKWLSVFLLLSSVAVGDAMADPAHPRFGKVIGPYWVWSPYAEALYRPLGTVGFAVPQATRPDCFPDYHLLGSRWLRLAIAH